MQDNKNTSFCQSNTQNGGTVCIDTKRVLDGCRDRDCFENARVYFSTASEQLLTTSTNIKTRSTELIWAYVGVDDVPFNCGFYKVTVKYYIQIEFEICLGGGRSQTFNGLVVLDKNVVLYGGEGRAITYSSSPNNTYCNITDYNTVGNNDPTAIVETVEPIILNTKVNDCTCPCSCTCTEYLDIPAGVQNAFGEVIVLNSDAPRVYVSVGIFSVIRMVRPAQLLIQGTDYCVPDKECTPATNPCDPCALFSNIAFPISQFKGTCNTSAKPEKSGGCGCKGN